VDGFILARAMTPSDGLEFNGRVPPRGHDVNARRVLEVESLAARLDLNEKDHTAFALVERLNVGNTFVLGKTPVDANVLDTGNVKDLGENVHFVREVAEHERIFVAMRLEVLEQLGVFRAQGLVPRRPVPDGIEVDLGVRHDLATPQKGHEHTIAVHAPIG